MVYALNVKVGFRPNDGKIQLYSSVEVLNLKKCSRIPRTLPFRSDQWPQASQNLSLLRLTTESLVISSLILLRPHQFMFRYLVHFRDDFRSISKKVTRSKMVKIWRLKTACIDKRIKLNYTDSEKWAQRGSYLAFLSSCQLPPSPVSQLFFCLLDVFWQAFLIPKLLIFKPKILWQKNEEILSKIVVGPASCKSEFCARTEGGRFEFEYDRPQGLTIVFVSTFHIFRFRISLNAIHSTKVCINFGSKVNKSVRCNWNSFDFYTFSSRREENYIVEEDADREEKLKGKP